MTLLKLVACLFTSKHVYYSINNRQSNQKQAKKAKHLVQYFCLVLYCVFFCMAVLFLLLFTYIKYLTSLFLTLSSISSTISLTLSGVVVPFRNFKRTFVRCFFYVQNIWKFFVCKKKSNTCLDTFIFHRTDDENTGIHLLPRHKLFRYWSVYTIKGSCLPFLYYYICFTHGMKKMFYYYTTQFLFLFKEKPNKYMIVSTRYTHGEHISNIMVEIKFWKLSSSSAPSRVIYLHWHNYFFKKLILMGSGVSVEELRKSMIGLWTVY